MWLLICVFIFVCASVSADAAGQVPSVFHKCCPKNHSLVKKSELNTTEESFECLDSNSLENLYNISTPPLVIGDYVPVEYGIPNQCDKLLISTQVNEVEFSEIENQKCYDKMVLQINNGTLKPSIPKTVAITCIINEIDNLPKQKIIIDHIRKCCSIGQTYDTTYHLCRRSDPSSSEDMLIKLLNLNSNNIYEIEIGLDCKADEYGVELSEELHSLVVEGSSLKVITKSTGVTSTISQGEWCIDRKYAADDVVARVCTSDCSSFDAYCVRKCCPVGKHYRTLRCGSPISKCVPNEDEVPFDILMYLEPLKNEYNISGNVCPLLDLVAQYTLGIRSDLHCLDGKVMLNRSVDVDAHQLTPEGFLKSSISEHAEYCLEAFDSRYCPGGDISVTAVTCFVKPLVTKDYRISFVIISISSVCLALTLIVYCALPELRNLHGRTLICHVSMMLLAFSCLARVQYAHVPNPRICTFLGYGIYFGFVAAFSWLNVMCLDIWWTFGSVRTIQPLRKAGAERRRFLWYSLYAWSFAITLTLIMFLLDMYPISNILDANIGNGICWFASIQNSHADWPHYIFFVIPMGLVSCTNFVLWILTARHCARVKSEVHRLQAGSVGDRAKRRFRVDRAKYILTGKLWVVMGAGWVSELLSTLASEPKWLWTMIDLLNELQGVFIFLILVFKPKLYYLIRKRLGLEKPDAQKNGPSSSARTSSTFLSRTISSDERTNLRTSQLNNMKQN